MVGVVVEVEVNALTTVIFIFLNVSLFYNDVHVMNVTFLCESSEVLRLFI